MTVSTRLRAATPEATAAAVDEAEARVGGVATVDVLTVMVAVVAATLALGRAPQIATTARVIRDATVMIATVTNVTIHRETARATVVTDKIVTDHASAAVVVGSARFRRLVPASEIGAPCLYSSLQPVCERANSKIFSREQDPLQRPKLSKIGLATDPRGKLFPFHISSLCCFFVHHLDQY